MCSDVLSYQLLGVWQACPRALFIFKKIQSEEAAQGNLRPSFFFPTWVFGLYIDSIFILCWDCSKQHQNQEVKGMSQRTLTVLIIFSITSDDKPDLQRSLHELPWLCNVCWTCQMPLVELNQLLKCSPTFMKGVPQLKQGELLSYV